MANKFFVNRVSRFLFWFLCLKKSILGEYLGYFSYVVFENFIFLIVYFLKNLASP